MNKLKNIIIISLIFLTAVSSAQTVKLIIIDPNLKHSQEEISVLKSNNSIRDGNYKRTFKGDLCSVGEYKNGEKVGIWRSYGGNERVDLEINFESGALNYFYRDSITREKRLMETQLIPNSSRPALNILGADLVQNYLMYLLKYPRSAMEMGIQGKVKVVIEVSSTGTITGYSVETSGDRSLDAEALRVVKLMPFEFLPAYKDGQAVGSYFELPVSFKLE